MDFISPFKNQLEIWSNLIFKDILFDSKINEMSSKALNDKIIYHRCVCYIAQFENYIFGSFIGETIPFAEEKMSSAIENDWKHFIFSLQNHIKTNIKHMYTSIQNSYQWNMKQQRTRLNYFFQTSNEI